MIAIPQDQEVRERIAGDHDTTLFIEAGAGTGKTTAVVSRIVSLVVSGRLAIDRLVAITFTEAAAAELRVRVRQALETAWDDARLQPDQRARAQTAVEGLGRARIDTIHGFASELLRTWPIEAGLPPGFTVLDDIEQQVLFRDRLGGWLDSLEVGSPAGEAAQRVLLLGLKPKHLLEAMLGLEANHDMAGGNPQAAPAAVRTDAVGHAHGIGAELVGLGELRKHCHTPDALHAVLSDLQFAAGRLLQAQDESSALVALQLVERVRPGNSGNAKYWSPLDGENACKTIKRRLPAALAEADECLAAHRTRALSRVLVELRNLVLDSVADRRRQGDATFHDLLTWARDLLRDHPEVRHAAQQRWDRIIVDEFQDTDPLQVELAFMLAAEPAPPLPDDWRAIRLVPGKLTLVGDPKQSIYRFRRADIAAYQEVATAVEENGGATLHLTENFRSVSRVIDWVNHHFIAAMTPSPFVQPNYVPLTAHHPDSGTGVWRMGDALPGKMGEVWQAEATAVARVARRAVEESWPVHAGSGTREARPATYGDICILIPTRTNLRRLERALQDEAVPYQVASGSLIVATQEVRDLVSCLRAIDDPSDQVAVVAALRSPAFGVDDVELLRWRESGGGLDYQHGTQGDGDRIRAAFSALDELHKRRHQMSPAALVEAFCGERLLIAAAVADRRSNEVWRRYRYVAARARAFAATGRTTLRVFLDWMDGLQRDQVRDAGGTTVDPTDCCVRIMTIHGAKGLEFPIVALTGCGSKGSFRCPSCIPDRRRGSLDFHFTDFGTPDFEEQKKREREMDDAESLRLMYVAATRARDHLILCLFRGKAECHATAFAAGLAGFDGAQEVPATPPLPAERVELRTPEPLGREPAERTRSGRPDEPAASGPRTAEEDRLEEAAWLLRRTGLIAANRALDIRSATGIAHHGGPMDERSPDSESDVATYRRGRAGTSRGRAVHAVLQVVDLSTLEGLADLVRAQTMVEGIAGDAERVARLVHAACTSEAVERAVGGGRYWREMPVGVNVDGVILEGFIDLLYEEPDGSMVVVDYKTDELSPGQVGERMARYRLQGGAYALAIERVTTRPVARVEFVFAALGITRSLPDLAGAVTEVQERLAQPRIGTTAGN